MNWYVIFYLFSLADKISITFNILAVISSIGLAISVIAIGVCVADNLNDGYRVWKRVFFSLLFSALFSWTLWVFIPSRQDMLVIIAGGSVGQFIMNDENARAIPSDVTRFLRKEILEATSELENPEKIKEALGLETEADKLKQLSKEELIKMLTDKKETNQTETANNF